jgi:hypothetical protein
MMLDSLVRLRTNRGLGMSALWFRTFSSVLGLGDRGRR